MLENYQKLNLITSKNAMAKSNITYIQDCKSRFENVKNKFNSKKY